MPHDEACRSLRTSTVFGRLPAKVQAQATGETHVALFRPSWKRKPFPIFVFRIWSRRMFIWSQWCAWSSGFRRKVATAPSFLVAKSRVPVAKCDYVPGIFEPCLCTSRTMEESISTIQCSPRISTWHKFASPWSAAADCLSDCSGERRTSPFNGDPQSGNGIERKIAQSCRSPTVSACLRASTTFPTALSLYIAQGRLRKDICYPSCSQRQNRCHSKRK